MTRARTYHSKSFFVGALALLPGLSLAQPERSYFVEGSLSPGLTLNGSTGTNFGLQGSAGLRFSFFSAEVLLGDLVFREDKDTSANATFISAGVRLFIPASGRSEAFFRASIGGGSLFDASTLASESAVINSFGAGAQYHLTPHQLIGASADFYSVQPSSSAPALGAGALSLRFGYAF